MTLYDIRDIESIVYAAMLDLNNNRTTSASFNDLDNIDGSDQEQFDDRTVLSIADLPDAFFDNPDLKVSFLKHQITFIVIVIIIVVGITANVKVWLVHDITL